MLFSSAKPPILVQAPVAESTQPPQLPCPQIDNNAVDPATLMPPGNIYRPVFQSIASGNRNYTCEEQGIDLNSLAVATFVPVNDSGFMFSGEAYYNAANLPEINLKNPDGSAAGKVIVDSAQTIFQSLGGALKWRSWPILLITGPSVPWAQYIVMNETQGGEPPAPSACQPGQKWVLSPYKAKYTFWAC